MYPAALSFVVGVLLTSPVFAQIEDAWLGNWVEGEKGASRYTKIRLASKTIAFTSGNRSDTTHFPPSSDPAWCWVRYRVVSSSVGETYPDQLAVSQDTAKRLARTFKIRRLELEHTKCTGFKFLQLAFPSDIGHYADVIQYSESSVVGWTHYIHQMASRR
jgi:hypothetical protein